MKGNTTRSVDFVILLFKILTLGFLAYAIYSPWDKGIWNHHLYGLPIMSFIMVVQVPLYVWFNFYDKPENWISSRPAIKSTLRWMSYHQSPLQWGIYIIGFIVVISTGYLDGALSFNTLGSSDSRHYGFEALLFSVFFVWLLQVVRHALEFGWQSVTTENITSVVLPFVLALFNVNALRIVSSAMVDVVRNNNKAAFEKYGGCIIVEALVSLGIIPLLGLLELSYASKPAGESVEVLRVRYIFCGTAFLLSSTSLVAELGLMFETGGKSESYLGIVIDLLCVIGLTVYFIHGFCCGCTVSTSGASTPPISETSTSTTADSTPRTTHASSQIKEDLPAPLPNQKNGNVSILIEEAQ